MKRGHRIVVRYVMVAASFLVLPASAARPPESGTLPVAHGDIVRNFARITFEWPDSVYFIATAQGNSVSVTFDRKANPDFTKLLQDLRPYVKKAVRKSDGKTIIFTLDKPYRIRTFVSDNINGIDLLDVDVRKHKQPVKEQAVAAKTTPPAKQAVDASKLASLAPAAGEAEKPAEAAATPASAPVIETPAAAPEAEIAAPAAEAVPAPAVAATAPAEAPKEKEQAAEVELPVPLNYDDAGAKTKKGFVKLGLSPSSDSATLRFPFPERVAMAAFIRNQKLWIVIDKPLSIDVSDFGVLPDTVVGKPEVIPAEKSTTLIIPLREVTHPIVTRETNSFNWAVLLTGQKKLPEKVLRPEINTEPPAPPHVFVAALEVADPITLYDPEVGDQLIVTPLYTPGEGVAVTRDFIEFGILQTAQGIAVQKKADDVTVALLRNGIRVSVAKGATLTPGLPAVDVSRASEKMVDLTTLFPYKQWKVQDELNMQLMMNGLFHRSVEAKEEQEKSEARLRMAQVYLSEGMAVEAIGMLEGIRRTNPAYYKSTKLAAMQGAASFLLYRYADAARAFAAAELNGIKEIDFWRKLVADLLGHPNQNYDYLAMNDEYISKYPPSFRQRIAIVAADRLIFDKEYNTALKVFDTINDPEIIKPINNYVNFLMATISANNGQEEDALAAWDMLAEDYSHLFVRASAELSRIIWGIGHGDLTREDAFERLEKLRLAWHGDRLELQVMTLLGNMYEEQKDFVNAMRIWHGGITSFPNSAIAIEMTKKMQEAFIYMFSEGGADDLPPIDVLAMYYEYQNYAPTGTTGNELTEKLASRLISVDLLAQAAELLDRQMRFSAEKEERSRVGAKLATIHLLNNQPQKALSVLQDSLYGENSLPLRMMRNRITAEALVAQGSVERALHVLGQDTTPEAELIRLNIYWQQRDWEKVIAGVESMLKVRENPANPLTLDETESLLKLALAYIFQNNTVQLQYLRDYFTPLMQDNPYKSLFDFVTNSNVTVTTTNFDEVIQNLSNTRTFIENYQARVRTASLDTASTTK